MTLYLFVRLMRRSILTACFVVIAALAWAQATAQLSGRVTDESGAVLPGRHRDGHADRYGVHAYRRHR